MLIENFSMLNPKARSGCPSCDVLEIACHATFASLRKSALSAGYSRAMDDRDWDDSSVIRSLFTANERPGSVVPEAMFAKPSASNLDIRVDRLSESFKLVRCSKQMETKQHQIRFEYVLYRESHRLSYPFVVEPLRHRPFFSVMGALPYHSSNEILHLKDLVSKNLRIPLIADPSSRLIPRRRRV